MFLLMSIKTLIVSKETVQLANRIGLFLFFITLMARMSTWGKASTNNLHKVVDN